MAKFAVRNDVPRPALSGRRAGSIYPFMAMEKGDSFFVLIGSGETAQQLRARLTTAAWRWRTAHDQGHVTFEVAEHLDPETCKPAVGVWRTA